MVAKQWCIGVLGCGYVGQQLLQQQWHSFSWCSSSWYTIHQNDAQLPYQSIGFSLDNSDSWDNLPQQADCLVFTIPPGYQDSEKEIQRLTDWCDWMKLNRPGLKRLMYISTIGVYADGVEKDSDIYTERSQCQPSSLKGDLRLMSEQVLSRYFQCTAIRCGGIYGPGRNIVEKLLAGEAVYRGNKPMYRIHVEDLVNIIAQLVQQSAAMTCINAVDDQSASQDEIIEWLLRQADFKEKAPQSLRFQAKRLDADATGVARIISNRLIFEGLGYRLQYPNFKALFPSSL